MFVEMDLLESRQLNNYQDKRMMVSQQAMKELLLETEQLLEQTRFGISILRCASITLNHFNIYRQFRYRPS